MVKLVLDCFRLLTSMCRLEGEPRNSRLLLLKYGSEELSGLYCTVVLQELFTLLSASIRSSEQRDG